MRRRRVLTFSAAAVGLGGTLWYSDDIRDDIEDAVEGVIDAADTRRVEGTDGESVEPAQAQPVDEGPRIGATLNGRARRLRNDLDLVGKSNTRWTHAFLDVREKYEGDVTPEKDADVTALRRVAAEKGVKLVVSLRWDFFGIWGDKPTKHVPEAGSEREQALFEYATELLGAIDQPVEVVVLGNEPIWETPDGDVKGEDAPLVPFTRRLKDHLVQHYGGDPQLLVGAFNRLYDRDLWNEYKGFYRKLFGMVRRDDDIDGVDLHIHYDELGEAETMLAAARKAVPDATVTATEFSPVWRYERNKNEPIAGFEGGDRFVNRYGFSDDTTVMDYFQAAKDDPRPREEMADFMDAMPWYNVDFVEDMYDLLNEYGVSIGTVGFLQGVGIRNTEWTSEWMPFTINYLFQRGLIATKNGAHPHYLDDYRNRA